MKIRSMIKRDSKTSLSGNWLVAIMLSIGWGVLYSIGMAVFRTGNAVSLLAFLAIAPISLGIVSWYLSLLRKQDHSGNLIFSWINQEKYLSSLKTCGFFWLIKLGQTIASVIVPVILLIIGGIASASFFALHNFMFSFRDWHWGYFGQLFRNSYLTLVILAYAIVFLIIEIYFIRFSAIYNIMCDQPQKSLSDAIGESKNVMRGHTWEMVVFYLSFFGWYLLVPVTFGLILLYLAPYMKASKLLYIEYLRDLHRKKERMCGFDETTNANDTM